MIAFACFLLGVSLTLLAQYEVAIWRLTRRPPSKVETGDLLAALSVWAEKYQLANPKKKCFKQRDGELFAACTKVGLMWLRPQRKP